MLPANTAKNGPKVCNVLDPALNPWDYHPWETMPAYTAFQIYLRGGRSRSLAKVQLELMPREKRQALEENARNTPRHPKGGRLPSVPGGRRKMVLPTSLKDWSHLNLWPERAAAWDQMLIRVEQEEIVDKRKQLAKNCDKMGETIAEVGMNTINKLKQSKALLKPDIALKLVEGGVKLQRQGLGIDEETAAVLQVNVQTNFNLDALAPNELRNLIEIQKKMAPKGLMNPEAKVNGIAHKVEVIE